MRTTAELVVELTASLFGKQVLTRRAGGREGGAADFTREAAA